MNDRASSAPAKEKQSIKRARVRGTPKGRSVDPKAREEVRDLLKDAPLRRDLLIEYLHRVQDRYGHLSAAHLVALAEEMKLAMTEVYEVATFYHHFDVIREGEAPPPAITVRVCDSIACDIAGSHELLAKLPGILGTGVRVLHAPCIGRCETAPAAVVGQNPLPHASAEKIAALVKAKALKHPAPGSRESHPHGDIVSPPRDEYHGCRAILEREIGALRANPPCRLPPIHLRRGAGAYICGEESAMIESIEGKRGMPRLRPPYVAQVGLFGRPTLEHNMETLHWVREILEKGADWFASQGRNGRKGLRSFSVSGRVKKPGVHLAPAGITVKELIAEYCGGMLDGHEFYGYLPGGASGGILPASKGDIPLDFDTLQPHGCFIGSAAIVIFSDKDKASDAARNLMAFFKHESCGQCTPCRVGTAKALQLMDEARWNQPLLSELSQAMMDASICGLGQAAPNPVLSVMKYFPQEIS